MSAITISAAGLIKEFASRRRTIRAVDGIDLAIQRGETFGLVGPDGAGKTTLIRVLLGLMKRTSGSSSILGLDSMDDVYAIREQVGYIAQQFSLPPDLSVIENLRFFARIQRVHGSDSRQRIQELLEFAGLGRFQRRLAGDLSGGMKKKLALACSLVHNPPVLVLDEPTLGVDPVSRREFWSLLGNLRAERGVTILVCTPYMDEAERCSRVGLIYRGRLIARGTPDAVKGLVPGQLIQVTPSDLSRAVDLAAGVPGVLEVQTYGLSLHIFVQPDQGLVPRLVSSLAAQDITCRDVRQIEPRMEEAFISLIGKLQAKSLGPQSPISGSISRAADA